jgi:hypothetical protein
MVVVGPELLAGIDLVDGAADQLGADPPADRRLPDPEPVVLLDVVPLVRKEVGDFHRRAD